MRSIGLILALTAASTWPAPPPGALVMCGGGKLPAAARTRFMELAGGAKAVIVVIPTASQAADDPRERDSFLSTWREQRPARVEWLHTRDRKVADSEEFCQLLAVATGVWFSGGDQSRLAAVYLGTRTAAAVRAVLRRGGVVGGTSAGAAIMGDPMIVGGEARAELAPGFGLLSGIIVDQHFLKRQRGPRLTEALSRHPQAQGLGIDEDTAVVIHEGRLAVLGTSAIKVYTRRGPAGPLLERLVRAGESISFPPEEAP